MRQPQQARRHQLLLPRARLLSLALPVLAALLPAAHGGLFSRGAERGAGWQLAPSEAGAAALRLRGGHGGGCPCEGATKTMMWLYDEVCLGLFDFPFRSAWMRALAGKVFRV